MKLKVVICGSYHRDPNGLKRIFRELEANGCRILSPLSLDFDNSEYVVRSKSEQEFTALELEKYHLRAIEEADFLWLHAPSGYIGISTSFKLGYSLAINKPIFSYIVPNDEMLKGYIQVAGSVFEAVDTIS